MSVRAGALFPPASAPPTLPHVTGPVALPPGGALRPGAGCRVLPRGRVRRREGPLPRRQRWRLAVAERLPAWAQPRCGVEPRTVAAVCVLLAVATGFAVHHFWTGRPQEVPPVAEPAAASSPAPSPASPSTAAGPERSGQEAEGAGDAGEEVVVDVAGEVRKPGVYTLPPGSRVGEAVDSAGGTVPGTDTAHLNRARVLTDGEHIVVGSDAAAEPSPPVASGGAAAPRPGGQGGPLPLNTATAEQLESLPGVGPVLAGHIVTHRQQHGPFATVEELVEVSGIGERRLADLRDRVVV